MKEQIKEILTGALKDQIDACLELYGETGMNYPNLQPNDRELDYFADQILALFPQGKDGVLSDDEICKIACEALSELVALKAELEGENG